MRRVACVLFAFLFGDSHWVSEYSDFLVVTACSNQRSGGAHRHTIYVAISNVLVNLLNAESKFARPSRPLHISARRSTHIFIQVQKL